MKDLAEVRIGEIQPTKFAIEMMADTVAERVMEGHADAVNIAVQLAAVDQLSKAIRERIGGEVIFALGKYPKMKAEVMGASVTAVDTPRYDYSHVEGWAELDTQIKELTERRKAIEEEEKKYRRGELPVLSVSQTFKINIAK